MSQQKILKNLEVGAVTGRQIIHVDHRQADEPFVRDGGPHVECIREDQVVQRIRIRCTCGQMIELVCDYE